MCLSIYLVTDADLPELPWDTRQPAFYVERLKRKERFLRGLSGNNAYLLGSHEGCGCGFLSDGLEPKELAPSAASRRALSQYVEEVNRGGGDVFLLAVWAGDEGKPAVRGTVTSEELVGYPWDQTWEAPHLLRVIPAPGNASARL
jgi:hypothetical protein